MRSGLLPDVRPGRTLPLVTRMFLQGLVNGNRRGEPADSERTPARVAAGWQESVRANELELRSIG
jgi:hypothetical protein